MAGFVIWVLVGILIIALGIRDLFAKKPVGFWANVESMKVSDVNGYNRAVGILFMVYGFVFIALGIPLLAGQNTPIILLSIIGVMFETIAVMAIYSISIVSKYKVEK